MKLFRILILPLLISLGWSASVLAGPPLKPVSPAPPVPGCPVLTISELKGILKGENTKWRADSDQTAETKEIIDATSSITSSLASLIWENKEAGFASLKCLYQVPTKTKPLRVTIVPKPLK